MVGEYFGKYQEAPRRETNSTLDNPVIFLWGFTKMELATGLFIVLPSFYLLEVSWLLTLVGTLSVIPILKAMRFIREDLPPNFFNQFAWLLGLMNKKLERHIRRPEKTYLTR